MKNRILKKSNDKKIAGICSGIAEYFGWKPLHVRMIFVAVTILGASGLIAYIILYFVMPNHDNNAYDSFNIDDHRG